MERLIFGRIADIQTGEPVPAEQVQGYAVLPGFGNHAHWFVRDVPRVCSIDGVLTLITPVTTACGHTRFELKTSALMEVGAFPKCIRCVMRGDKA